MQTKYMCVCNDVHNTIRSVLDHLQVMRCEGTTLIGEFNIKRFCQTVILANFVENYKNSLEISVSYSQPTMPLATILFILFV